MTFIGKLFVFLNLVMSIVFAGFAVGIYTNRIDWPGRTGGDTPAGVFQRKQDEAKQLKEGVERAQARWERVHNNLLALEDERPNQRRSRAFAKQFYAAELKKARDGPGPI